MTTKITEQNVSSLANFGVDWQAVHTGDGSTGITAVAGRGYFIDNSSGTTTLTLPANATRGDTIGISDPAGSFQNNNLTISRNGHKIDNATSDLTS